MFKAALFRWVRVLVFGSFLVWSLSAVAQTGSVTLAWMDTDPTVAGYDVYYGTSSGTYTGVTDAGDSTNATVSSLQEGTTYYFAVTAYNSNGVQSAYSSEISYTVPPGTNAPVIVLTSPGSGSGYVAPANVPLTASVTPNGHSISEVQFYNGATLLGTAASAPYSFTWQNVPAGAYSVSAQLVYDSGSTLSSSSASITVHPAPTISTISNQVVLAGSSTPISLVVSDSETAAANLTLTASSDNPSVVGGIVFSGTGANRTATITPIQSGYAHVTFTVSYGIASASTTFQLTVLTASAKPAAIITMNGSGTLVPNLNQQTLTLGQSYTVTATPSAGETFTGWSGSVVSSSPTITFVLTSGFSLTANFGRSPYAKTSGTFSGLFSESSLAEAQPDGTRASNVNQVQPASAGAFTLTLSMSGAYSGHFQIGNKRYSFRGFLDNNGQASQSITVRGGSKVLLDLTMGTGSLANQVFGTLSDGTWTANLIADRAVYSARYVAPYQGRYTLILPGQPGSSALPAGDGYGSVHVTPSGIALFAGKLADGTTVSQSASVSGQGTWPLYISLYAGNGLLTGWMDFTNEVGDDLSGAATWVKPAQANTKYYPDGFTNEFEAVGSAYVQAKRTDPILTLTNGVTTFAGGALGGAFTNAITIGAGNRVTDLSGNPLHLSFMPATGLFSGRVSNPSSSGTLPFGGAVFQKLEAGYGFLLDAGQSSEVVIGEE